MPSLIGVKIDAENPNINTITPPLDATYDSSSNMDFKLTFNENINVTGAPRLSLNVGGQTRYADYHATAGSVLTFRYIPQLADQDTDGILFQSSVVHLNAGTIADAAGNLADLNFPASVPPLSGVRVDAQRAEVISFTPPLGAIYNSSASLTFLFTFNRDVNVTNTPRLALWVGYDVRYAEYQTTSSLRTLTFRYSPQSGDLDDNGISLVNNHIDLDGGSINDSRGQTAHLDFSGLNMPDMSGITVDAVLPAPVGLANDAVYRQSKNWSWGCSKQNCNYRFVVDTNPSSVLTGAYGTMTSTSQPNGDGTYYLHIQLLDSLNNESQVQHFSTKLDNTAPNFSGTLDISNDNVSTTRAPSVDWSATVSSDAHSFVSKIEIAIGRDVTGDGLDAIDRNNIVGWREIPGGASLNPRHYKVQNGVDGFFLDLTSDVDYFTSLRLEDAAGNKSAELSSDPWGLFDPRRVEGLELWLDGQDLSTLFKDDTCTNDLTTDGQRVGCWRDKSGGGHHVIQNNDNKRPTYQQGGHIFFGASNHFLTTGNLLSGTYDELSVFIVFNQVANPLASWPIGFSLNENSGGSCSDPNQTTRIMTHMFEGNKIYWFFGSCNSQRSLNTNANAANGTRNFYHLGGSVTDNLIFIRKNGVIISSKNASYSVSPSPIGHVVIGNGEGNNSAVNGRIGEFIVYTSHLSVVDRKKIEGYLACKWNLQSELSNTHPYATTCP